MKTIKPLLLSAVLATLTFTASAQTWLTNGLVAYYPFDGNANDMSGNGINGTPGSVTYAQDRFGYANGSLALAGYSSSNLKINSTALNLPPDFTVSVWINFTANAGSENPRVLSTAGYEVGTQTTASSRLAYLNNTTLSAGAPTVNSSNTIPAGVWVQIVGVRVGNELVLYVNGKFAGSVSTTQPPDYSRDFIPEIGGNSGSAADNYAGLVDDLRIYSRALSSDEVAQLYVYEAGLNVDLIKAVKPSFSNLTLTTNYQMQVSSDLNNWTNHGAAFTATNTSMIWPQYFDVDNWGSLFFRLQSQ